MTIQSYSLDGDDRLGFGAYGQLDQATAASITLQSGSETLTIQVDPDSGETYVGGSYYAPSRILPPSSPGPHPRFRSRLAFISGKTLNSQAGT